MKVRRSNFSADIENSHRKENENRNPLFEHMYIKSETLIENNDVIHENGSQPYYFNYLWQKILVFVISKVLMSLSTKH